MSKLIVKMRPTCAACGKFLNENPYYYIEDRALIRYCSDCRKSMLAMDMLMEQREDDDD